MDPFGYYAEGIQQGLDDAFKTKLTTSSPYGYQTPPDGSPSAGLRPVSAPRPSIRSSEDASLPKDRPFSAPPVPDAAPGETGVKRRGHPGQWMLLMNLLNDVRMKKCCDILFWHV